VGTFFEFTPSPNYHPPTPRTHPVLPNALSVFNSPHYFLLYKPNVRVMALFDSLKRFFFFFFYFLFCFSIFASPHIQLPCLSQIRAGDKHSSFHFLTDRLKPLPFCAPSVGAYFVPPKGPWPPSPQRLFRALSNSFPLSGFCVPATPPLLSFLYISPQLVPSPGLSAFFLSSRPHPLRADTRLTSVFVMGYCGPVFFSFTVFGNRVRPVPQTKTCTLFYTPLAIWL